MLALLQTTTEPGTTTGTTTGGGTTASSGTTVALDPEQLRIIVEHGQANTYAILMFIGIAVLCLGGLVFMSAVRG